MAKSEMKGGDVAIEQDSVPSDSPSDLQLILGAITDLSAKVNDLTVRVENAERSVPKIAPMENDSLTGRYGTAMEAARQALGKTGEIDGVLKQLPQFANSMEVPKDIFAFMTPKFQIGQRVRINPDAVKMGGVRTWSEVIGNTDTTGFGTIRKVTYMTRQGEWKYKVRIPGLTNSLGDGFRESELLPA
jgi:hypothetical protein